MRYPTFKISAGNIPLIHVFTTTITVRSCPAVWLMLKRSYWPLPQAKPPRLLQPFPIFGRDFALVSCNDLLFRRGPLCHMFPPDLQQTGGVHVLFTGAFILFPT